METRQEQEARWTREDAELKALHAEGQKLRAQNEDIIRREREPRTPINYPKDTRTPEELAAEYGFLLTINCSQGGRRMTASLNYLSPGSGTNPPFPMYDLSVGSTVSLETVKKLQAGDEEEWEKYQGEGQ